MLFVSLTVSCLLAKRVGQLFIFIVRFSYVFILLYKYIYIYIYIFLLCFMKEKIYMYCCCLDIHEYYHLVSYGAIFINEIYF